MNMKIKIHEHRPLAHRAARYALSTDIGHWRLLGERAGVQILAVTFLRLREGASCSLAHPQEAQGPARCLQSRGGAADLSRSRWRIPTASSDCGPLSVCGPPFSPVPTHLRDLTLSVFPPNAGVAHDTCGGRHGRLGTSGGPGSQREKQYLISIYFSPESLSAMSASWVVHPKAESRGPRFLCHLPLLCLSSTFSVPDNLGSMGDSATLLSASAGVGGGRRRIGGGRLEAG